MKSVFVILVTLALTGCGTISGMGKDISGAADWTKEKIVGSDTKTK